jgi:hypothetical protein
MQVVLIFLNSMAKIHVIRKVKMTCNLKWMEYMYYKLNLLSFFPSNVGKGFRPSSYSF